LGRRKRLIWAVDRADFGTRESRHINSVEQNNVQHVTAGRRTGDSWLAWVSWGLEWHHERETFESSFVYPPGRRTYDHRWLLRAWIL